MDGLKHEILLLWSKIWLSVIAIAVGIIGKFSYDMSIGKKYTKTAFFGSLGVCIFIGYITATICQARGWITLGSILTPIATALSLDLFRGLMQNWKKFYNKLAGGISKIEDDENKS